MMTEINSLHFQNSSDNRIPQGCNYWVTFKESNHSICLNKNQFMTYQVISLLFVASYVFWKCVRFWRFLVRCFANSPTWINFYFAIDMILTRQFRNIYCGYLFALILVMVVFVDCPLYLGRKLGIIPEYTPPNESPDSNWTPSFPVEPSIKNIR